MLNQAPKMFTNAKLDLSSSCEDELNKHAEFVG